MTLQEAIKPLLDYNQARIISNDGVKIIAKAHNRNYEFRFLQQDIIGVVSEGNEFTIDVEEMVSIEHILFPRLKILNKDDYKHLLPNIQPMKKNDIAFRLHLVLEGDIVESVEKVLFVDGGVQKDKELYRSL